MSHRDRIVKQALGLSPEDRTFVADALEQSLANDGFASPEVASAWAVEVERRIAAFDLGEVQATHIEPAIERMRRALEKHRAGKVSR